MTTRPSIFSGFAVAGAVGLLVGLAGLVTIPPNWISKKIYKEGAKQFSSHTIQEATSENDRGKMNKFKERLKLHASDFNIEEAIELIKQSRSAIKDWAEKLDI